MSHNKLSIWEKAKAKLPYITAVANSSLFILHSSFFIACTENTFFHSYKSLPAEGWERRDTICFDVPQQAEDIDGTLTIGLRTKANIGIQDVAIAVEQRLQAPAAYRCDTVRYPLTDAEGTALTGGINIHQYETQHLPLHLQKGQQGTIRIHHLMRRELIPGITDIGIRVEAQ